MEGDGYPYPLMPVHEAIEARKASFPLLTLFLSVPFSLELFISCLL